MLVHLVDGTFELFRGYYGAPERKNKDGLEVGAARSVARSILALLSEKQVTHVAVAFDHVVESFRNDLFDGYKTGDGMDPVLYAQFPVVERAIELLGVVCWPMVEFEADDALATGAVKYGASQKVDRVILCTPDKDMAQCVNEKVVYWDRIRENTYGPQEVVAKFGVQPQSIPDYLALVGDTADGIPGIAGFGQKGAATILAEYGSLEKIPLATPWSVKIRGAAKLQDRLKEEFEDALLYKKLATLRYDVPLTQPLDDLCWQGPGSGVQELAELLADNTIEDRIQKTLEGKK